MLHPKLIALHRCNPLVVLLRCGGAGQTYSGAGGETKIVVKLLPTQSETYGDIKMFLLQLNANMG